MKTLYIFIQISVLIFHYLSVGVEATECNGEPKTNEGQLRKKLFCGYDRDSRPILASGPITIRFKMIVKAFAFEDTSSKLTVATWLAMSWTDEHLKWDPKEYGNLESITQSSDTIWQPDLALYNSDVASVQEAFCKVAHCVISSSGTVSCIPPCTHSALCTPKYDRWPFDTQNCTLHIGTWVNSGEEIDYKIMKIIINDDEMSSQNLQWKMLKATFKRNHGNFSETKQTYPSLTFSFLIERHAAAMDVTVLVPGIMVYVRDSLFITVFLIVNTIVVQGMRSFNVQTPAWVDKTTSYLEGNRFGQLLLTKHLVTTNNFSTHLDDNADDINLVESQSNEKDANKVKPNIWKTFGNIIDRSLFALFGIYYLFMVIAFLPEKFLDEKNLKTVEIIGY